MNKLLFTLLILIITSNVIQAQEGFGNCKFGLYSFGHCLTDTSIQIGGGEQCPFGQFSAGSYCIDNSLKPVYTYLGEQTFLQYYIKNFGVLQYNLILPSEEQTGKTLNITNVLLNERDFSIELNCYNFIDLNRNKQLDNNEPYIAFSKDIKPQIKTLINTSIFIPTIIDENFFFVGGICRIQPTNITSIAGNIVKLKSNNKTKIPSIYITIFLIIILTFNKSFKNIFTNKKP